MTPEDKLSPQNFLAVSDVAMDIMEKLQMTDKNSVTIKLMRTIIRPKPFNLLMPGDSISLRDDYCDYRWSAIKYLKDKQAIRDFKLIQGINRWISEVEIVLDKSDFKEYYDKLTELYQKRVVDPAKAPQPKDEARNEFKNLDPKFDVAKGEIILGHTRIYIASIGDYQHHICKELLKEDLTKKYKIGDWVSENYLEDSYSPLGVVMDTPFKSPRWVKDAVYKINVKVREAIKMAKFMDYGNANVRIVKENFE